MNYGVFNKQTLETIFLQDKAFINDLDGGMPFWPKYIYNDSTLVDYTDAYKILQAIDEQRSKAKNKKERNMSELLEMLGRQLDENSNPVLMVIHK
jgi:hypothetical protein